MEQPLIFQKFQSVSKNVPWVSLGQYPTPVERLQNLGKELGLTNLWIKRDDLTGELYGGNKVRPLEFCLAEARWKRADLLFAYSASGSNWPLACLVYAKLLGLPTDVFFFPFPMDKIKKKNLEITKKLARRVYSSKRLLTFPFLMYFNLFKAKQSLNVYLTPPGGVTPITTLGHINAVLELQEQVESGETAIPDYIFCPLGSGGTTAGLSIGLNIVGWPTKVIAVRVVDYLVANKWTLRNLIRRTINVIKRNGVAFSTNKNWGDNIWIEHNCFGKGYARPTPVGEQSIELFRNYENQLLDSTYTGKTFAAILAPAWKEVLKARTVLFWQTLNSRELDRLCTNPNFTNPNPVVSLSASLRTGSAEPSQNL